MKKIRLIAACIAAFVVIIICFAGLSGGGGKQSTEETVTKVKVVVAKKDIPAYSLITGDMVKVSEVAESALPEDATTYRKVKDVVGSITLSPIAAKETILSNHLRDADSATVTPSIDTDMRAITVGVTATTGVADLIRVGNRVDLFYAAEDSEHSGDTASSLIVENVTVLALDQQLSDTTAKTSTDDDSSSDSSSSSSSEDVYETVTLHVSVEQAAKISAAEQGGGTIYLALRAQDDNSSPGENTATTYDFR